jgi:hypothetical protein
MSQLTPSNLSNRSRPKQDEMRAIIVRLGILPRMLKRALEMTAKRILPTGGAPEKLSDPAKVRLIVDESYDELKTGKNLTDIQQDILGREKISLSTLQRRVREEMKRRETLLKEDNIASPGSR